jgi:hypothetical protein
LQVAAAKGLAAGAFSVHDLSEETVETRRDGNGESVLIRTYGDNVCIDVDEAEWILVVEKEVSLSLGKSAYQYDANYSGNISITDRV